jgi:hypothetical protein
MTVAIDRNKHLVYQVLPKGSVILRPKTNTRYRDYTNYYKDVTTKDWHVDGGFYMSGNLEELEALVGRQVHTWGGVYQNGASEHFYPRDQIVDKAVMWADGTLVEMGQYFEVEKNAAIMQYERDEISWKNELITTKAPRKYKGPVSYFSRIGDDAPDGRGAGFVLQYTEHGYLVRVEDAKPVAAPVRKEAEDTGPALRTLLVPQSKWKLTADLPLRKVKFTKVMKDNGHGRQYEDEEREPYVHATLPAGSELEVLQKPETIDNWSYSKHQLRGITGLYVQCAFTLNGKNYQHSIVYKDLVGIVEQVAAGKIESAFYIYDTAVDKYYKSDGTYYDANIRGWTTDGFEFAKKGITGARKFKRLGDVRAHVLNASGYYDGLPGAENLPDWMGGRKMFDVPETWEIHEVDKATKQVVRKVELIDTFKRSWKLRDLTMKYGSAVRSIYSDLEKKKKLGDFSAVLLFTKKDDDHRYYWDADLTPDEQAEIDEAISAIDKKDIKKGKGVDQRAFAIKDVTTGVMIRLTYQGSMEVALIDFQNMVEVMENKETESA